LSLSAIAFLALAGLLHAGWNLLVKNSRDKQAFLWLVLVLISLPSVVLFAMLVQPQPWEAWGLALLSGVFETVYFLLLGGAYGRGDLSLVYPLARGSAPLFATVFALLALHEPVRPLGFAGIALIGLGIYTQHLRTLSGRGLLDPLLHLRERPSQLALLTGLCIAGYSVVDKAALHYFPPFTYITLLFALPALMLTPAMILPARRQAVRAEAALHWRAILGVAVLMPVTYGIVILTLQNNPVSYVAAVREISVVLAAVFGTMVLREPFGRAKLLGAAFIFAGITLVALAG
jgi:drug/metabolite transporter (DMT)-like permease